MNTECHKKIYKTKQASIDAKNSVAERIGLDPDILRAYKCHRCNKWHLSKTPVEKPANYLLLKELAEAVKGGKAKTISRISLRESMREYKSNGGNLYRFTYKKPSSIQRGRFLWQRIDNVREVKSERSNPSVPQSNSN